MADLVTALDWTGEGLKFRGGTVGGPEIVVDGSNREGPSPVAALLLGIGGCMAADVVDIATKMRVPMEGLRVVVEGDRRGEPPRYLTAVRMKFMVRGVAAADEPKLRRAIDMSRDTYCSVLHSVRDDVDIGIDLELS
jgi:putative redox protein